MPRKPLIVGNWKLHKVTAEAIKLATEIRTQVKSTDKIDIAIAPPFTSLTCVEIALQDSKIKLAAQNGFFEEQGAFTGEISMAMLKDVGCTYVLLGHSERRHVFNESDEDIHKKLVIALQKDLIPIFCVGETLDQRKGKMAFEVVESQLKRGIAHINSSQVVRCVFAYEPVWAIGTGETASPAQAQEMHDFIRNTISKICDKPTANEISILYGGSVKPDNAENLLAQKDIDGLLIGGASLKSEDFTDIIEKANRI